MQRQGGKLLVGHLTVDDIAVLQAGEDELAVRLPIERSGNHRVVGIVPRVGGGTGTGKVQGCVGGKDWPSPHSPDRKRLGQGCRHLGQWFGVKSQPS